MIMNQSKQEEFPRLIIGIKKFNILKHSYRGLCLLLNIYQTIQQKRMPFMRNIRNESNSTNHSGYSNRGKQIEL